MSWAIDKLSPRPAPPPSERPPGKPPGDRYAAKALEGETAAVAAAPPGTRNARLNEAAFKLGTLAGAGTLTEHEVFDGLLAAAETNGLIAEDGRQQTERTIQSGFSKGRTQPREIPERPRPVPGRTSRQDIPPPDQPPDEPPEPRRQPAKDAHSEPPGGREPEPQAPDPDLDAFLDAAEPAYDWLIPGLLERADRLLVTGPEGGGKSTFLRQLAVQAGAGIHPFTHAPMAPVRTLLVDLENSPRHLRRQLRPLRALVAGIDPSLVRIVSHPQGIDLRHPADRAWLAERVELNRCELLAVGPLYKMAGGDPRDEEVARTVAAALDDLRVRHGFAVVIEAHSPYANSGGTRPTRPYGASLWSRWPEFGLHLAATGILTHWRGARDERAWPGALTRTGTWPWSVATSPTDVVWARIVDHVEQCLTRPSVRDLAAAIDVPKSTVDRAIQAHRADWDGYEERAA